MRQQRCTAHQGDGVEQRGDAELHHEGDPGECCTAQCLSFLFTACSLLDRESVMICHFCSAAINQCWPMCCSVVCDIVDLAQKAVSCIICKCQTCDLPVRSDGTHQVVGGALQSCFASCVFLASASLARRPSRGHGAPPIVQGVTSAAGRGLAGVVGPRQPLFPASIHGPEWQASRGPLADGAPPGPQWWSKTSRAGAGAGPSPLSARPPSLCLSSGGRGRALPACRVPADVLGLPQWSAHQNTPLRQQH